MLKKKYAHGQERITKKDTTKTVMYMCLQNLNMIEENALIYVQSPAVQIHKVIAERLKTKCQTHQDLSST